MILDPLEPLAVAAIEIPDFSNDDWEKQIKAMWEINCTASKALAGEVPVNDLLELVESQGVDPVAYAEAAIARLEGAIVADVLGDLDPGEVLAYVGH
jgi:hypothetical protein